MYSEYYLHQIYQPFDEGAVEIFIDQARESNDPNSYYSGLIWLTTNLFWQGADKGFGGGVSTGRFTPYNLKEKLAMEAAMADPEKGLVIPLTLNDSRWPALGGWVKMRQNINDVEIHYVRNPLTSQVADFKFK